MDTIYSRKRVKIPKIKMFFSPQRNNKKFKKVILLTLIIILIISINSIINSITPTFETLCNVRAKSIATAITNNCISRTINSTNYNDLVTLNKDVNGNITMVEASTIQMNDLAVKISLDIQEELNNLDKTTINIPSGSLTGNRFLAGHGPNIKIKLVPAGNVETSFKTEFVASGINQTVHKIYLQVKCRVGILSPLKTISSEIMNEVTVAETVIVGNVPSSYYNLEGIEKNDTLKLIE